MHTATEHAQRVLHGATLDDKLAAWPTVDVRSGAAVRIPDVPERPASLALPTQHRRLPSVWKADLQSESGRCRVLHELANHELQAIELMALALVRWPDAPAGFRRALVATLRDEQRHCQLYIDRLRACGGEVGDVPVSRFFWDTLGGIDDPVAFVAGMSLCFEAANLDFCTTWRTRFLDAGDSQTAGVLHQVYEDEIRHVATGLVWFGRWTEGDRVEAWSDALPAPLTPARARGPQFDAAGRARAGFSADEIQSLRVVGGSRGRPGRVLWFDPAVEERVSGRGPSAMSQRVHAALQTLPMFLCQSEDTVVAQAPSASFCNALADAGFAIPRFVDALTASELGPHPVASVEAWGAVPGVVVPSDIQVLGHSTSWQPQWVDLSSKVQTALRWDDLRQADWAPELGRVWTAAQDPGPGRWVLKAPFSASGTDRVLGEGPLTDAQQRWLTKQLARWGAVVWQPWYDRVVDLSVHLSVGDTVGVDGITRFSTTGPGVYTGAWLGRWTKGLPPTLQRAVHGGDRDSGLPSVEPILRQAGQRAGQWAQSVGYRGPMSIDAAIVRTDQGLALHPWLETNARNTLGRVALALRSRVDPRSQGWWRIARNAPDTHADLVRRLHEDPVQLRHGKMHRGTLATTPTLPDIPLLTWMTVQHTP